MIKTGIISSAGYTGGELARLLFQRGDTEIKQYGSRSYIGQKCASIHRNVFRIMDDTCMDDNMKELTDQVDMILTATPRGLHVSLVDEDVLSRVKVIDLSTGFRVRDVSVYEKQYELIHVSPRFVDETVYRLPKINQEKMKKARLIANPGCLPTCFFLSTYPLIKEGLIDLSTIVIDAKSGASGASRGNKVDSLYYEVNESTKAYRVVSHRHIPEIEEQLSCATRKSATVNSTLHLVPTNRGVLVVAYISLTRRVSYGEVEAVYGKYYRDEYFVRILERDVVPQTRQIEGSSSMDANFKIDTRTNRVVMTGATDNMVKEAADQAIQNMNLMFGLPENTELKQIPIFP